MPILKSSVFVMFFGHRNNVRIGLFSFKWLWYFQNSGINCDLRLTSLIVPKPENIINYLFRE